MADDEIVETEEPGETAEDNKNLARLQHDLEARCKAAELKLEEASDFEGAKYLRLYLPAGRQTYPIALFTAERIENLLAVQFEKYVLLGDYAAICSYADGTIEAGITSAVPFPTSELFRRITGAQQPSGARDFNVATWEVCSSVGREKIVLGPATPAFTVLSGIPRFVGSRPTFRIEGLAMSRHDDALELLERLSSSFFFQLDLLRDVTLTLTRRRRPLRTRFGHRLRPELKTLEFPKTEYDRDPISLYWYARSAHGMPLLQFLAYYQTIEYYFPSYSQAEARRKIRNILKSPTFRAERDADVARILLAARATGSGFGDERTQLRATLNECLEPGALREFFTELEDRAKFFSTKTEGLTDKRIAVRAPDADLRNDVADRIYDIRCKIVHTKSGVNEGDVELLLPFSKEAELLYADIELIQFVAREVLVSASTPLRLKVDPVTK